MSYTEGPWRTEKCLAGGLIVHRGKYHTQIFPEDDARLMAAAPYLLEACRLMSSAIVSLRETPQIYHLAIRLDEARNYALEIIDKATLEGENE